LVLITGASISLWPELTFRELGAWGYVRAGLSGATGIMVAVLVAMSPGAALASPRPALAAQVTQQSFGSELGSWHYRAMAGAPIAGLLIGLFAARRSRLSRES
jgi:hypothetical protein